MSALDSLGAKLSKIPSLRCLTTAMLWEVCNYFVSNLLCKIVGFVDVK
jgi:hypothetical protein